MKILQIRATRGPNYWSINRTHLIVMRLDLEEYEEKPSNKIEGFQERLIALLPQLMEHGCTSGMPGGFLARVTEGTWAGHIIEHLAIEIQTLAGMPVSFGRTRSTKEPGVYNVVFQYKEEEAGRYAARLAVDIFLDLAEALPLEKIKENLDEGIQSLREIREDYRLGPSTEAIVQEAASRDIPSIRLNNASLVQLGYGRNQERISASLTERTTQIAVDMAQDKYSTKMHLEEMGVPVPRGVEIRHKDDVKGACEEIGFPVAIKPLNSNQGKGITTGVTSVEAAQTAFLEAKEYSNIVIVEQSLTGFDFRALVINNKLAAVACRQPAHVIGDGVSTIENLIKTTNQDPRRGYGHENVLTKIRVDHVTLDLLESRGLCLESIPASGEIIHLKTTANLSTGGTSTDVTDEVHPDNVFLFERVAHFIGLDVAGVDIVAPNLSTPLQENGGGIVEVNAAPGLRMHLSPSEGPARNVAEPIVNMLFPRGKKGRIPIFSITGTNGKTTTTRLIAHIMKNVGYQVGFTTSEGVYVGNHMIQSGDNTGPISAQMILKDPEVELAVLETARGGIIRSGLGFDWCDIGVVTNVASDHLGINDIETLDDLAHVKSVVVESIASHGCAVLNADNDLVYEMQDQAHCRVAFFSMQADSPRLLEHVEKGGIGCTIRNDMITILKGQWSLPIEKIINIPLTYGGKATFMVQNVLAAALASYVHGLDVQDIRAGLSTFNPSVGHIPGRLNLFTLDEFDVLVDYAHNPVGVENLDHFLTQCNYALRTAVIGGTGDRRDCDIKELGAVCARIFDRIIVREEEDLRGRQPGEMSKLFVEGMKEEKPGIHYVCIEDPEKAIHHALQNAQKKEIVCILGGEVHQSIDLVTRFREEKQPMHLDFSDIPNQPKEETNSAASKPAEESSLLQREVEHF